jgi:hypothetical protein
MLKKERRKKRETYEALTIVKEKMEHMKVPKVLKNR